MERIVLKTPLFKEVLICLGIAALAVLGMALIYFGYRDSAWIMAGIGLVAVGVSIPGLLLEATSGTVLIADSEGVYTHAYALAKKKRTPWSAIDRFESGYQSFQAHGTSHKHAYLVVRLKKKDESLADSAATFFVESFSKMDKPYVPDDIYIPYLRLPGNTDDLVAQLEEYRARITA